MDNPAAGNQQGDAAPPPSDSPDGTAGKQKGAELSAENQKAAESDHDPANKLAWTRRQEHTLAERTMAFFTGVVALCAVIQIFILVGGSGQTDKLIAAANIQACAARQIAAASKRNAAAAESFATSAGTIKDEISDAESDFATMADNSAKAIKATQDSMRQDQRAWLAVTEISGLPEVGKPWIINLLMGNSGKTIAQHIRVVGISDQIPSPDEPSFTLEPLKERGIISPLSRGYAHIRVSHGVNLPQSVYDSYQKGQLRLFVYGLILYKDVFKREHSTQFCFVYVPDDPGFETYTSKNKNCQNTAD